MSRFVLSLILILSSFTVAACSGYKVAELPTNPASESTTSQDLPQLKKGAQARLHLVSGEVHEGEVVSVSEFQVTLGVPSNYGFVETAYAIDDIAKCEVQHASRSERIMAVGFGVVMAVAVVGLIVLAIMW